MYARIGARAREREMLAGAAIQRRDALAGHRLKPCALRGSCRASDQIERRFELRPLVLVQLLEMQRRHARRPSSHCATPSTRRVTSGPARPVVARTRRGERRELVEPLGGERRRARRERDDRGLIPRRERTHGRQRRDHVERRPSARRAAGARRAWRRRCRRAACSPCAAACSRSRSRRANGRKSATRSRLRVNEAAGVTGRPLSMTTLSPNTRLPGVAPERAELEHHRIEPLEHETAGSARTRGRCRRCSIATTTAAA